MVEAYDSNGEGSYVLEVLAGSKKLCLDATINLDSWGGGGGGGGGGGVYQPWVYQHSQFEGFLVRKKWRVPYIHGNPRLFHLDPRGTSYRAHRHLVYTNKKTTCLFCKVILMKTTQRRFKA